LHQELKRLVDLIEIVALNLDLTVPAMLAIVRLHRLGGQWQKG